MKNFKRTIVSTALFMGMLLGNAQEEVAVIGVRSDGPGMNESLCTSLIRIELGKTEKYKVLDDDDVTFALTANSDIDAANCYGIDCLTRAGETLGVNKVITGRFEKIGGKIIISIRLIDVLTREEELSSIGEFVVVEDRIQDMVQIVVNDMLGIENDKNLVESLMYYESFNSMPQTTFNLSGPRMGGAFILGEAGRRLTAPRHLGGYDMVPFVSQFGYQFETQYLSSGNFSALIEVIPMVSGVEQGIFRPSVAFLNGFRMNQQGWELAFGPSFSISKTAKGYYHPETNEWTLDNGDDYYTSTSGDSLALDRSLVMKNIDSRGDISLSTSWVWTLGKTFRSGYLNIPINLFVSTTPRVGTMLGFSVGFNIRKPDNSF